MLFVNFVYGHAIEITMGLISYANMSSDFLGEVLTRTAVTFFRTSITCHFFLVRWYAVIGASRSSLSFRLLDGASS